MERTQVPFMKIFEKQWQHLLALAVLLSAVFLVVRADGFLTGSLFGIGTPVWFYLALGVPILHQVYVWLTWRVELHYAWITRVLGPNGFRYYAFVFLVLLLSRLIVITALAVANRGTLALDSRLLIGAAVVIMIPVTYTFYSVMRYFGLVRALGIDHFDASYRRKPLVRQGIYKYVSNSMYVFGLLGLWVPGLLLASKAALLVALFSHLYVWVHYYTVERPDMKQIYGDGAGTD